MTSHNRGISEELERQIHAILCSLSGDLIDLGFVVLTLSLQILSSTVGQYPLYMETLGAVSAFSEVSFLLLSLVGNAGRAAVLQELQVAVHRGPLVFEPFAMQIFVGCS